MDGTGTLAGRDGNVDPQVAAAQELLVGRGVRGGAADLFQDLERGHHADRPRRLAEEPPLVLGQHQVGRVLAEHDFGPGLHRVVHRALRQGRPHETLDRLSAVPEGGHALPVAEDPQHLALTDHQQRLRP